MGIRFPLRRQYVFTSCIGDADCEASDIGHWLRNDRLVLVKRGNFYTSEEYSIFGMA